MIFNESGNGISSAYYEGSNEVSKYDLGIKGALMHIYENELNYNAMMKSVGLSELKYYAETGKDLFVHEAGAFSSFIEKAKAFFKKVIDKIVAIFNKFMTVINGFIMKDKAFVKKYELEIKRKNISDLEFNGYKKMIDSNMFEKFKGTIDISAIAGEYVKGYGKPSKITGNDIGVSKDPINTKENIEDAKEEIRYRIFNNNASANGSYTETEFMDELKEKFIGNKEVFDITDDHKTVAFDIISNSSKMISNINKVKKDIVDSINDYIKDLDRLGKDKDLENKVNNFNNNSNNANNTFSNVTEYHKIAGASIDIAKSAANDYTRMFGFMVDVVKKANRQARAICVKIIMYKPKNESAIYTNESYNDGDLFSGVNLI